MTHLNLLEHVTPANRQIPKSRRQEAYIYRDKFFQQVHFTSVPQSDDEAVDYLFSHTITLMGGIYVERIVGWSDSKPVSQPLLWYKSGEEGLSPWPPRPQAQ